MADRKVSSSGGDGGGSATAAAAVDRAASLLEAKDHEAAASLADEVLDNANRSVLAQAALIRGKALLQPHFAVTVEDFVATQANVRSLENIESMTTYSF